MKLSAYYKKKKEIVILSPFFSPDRHTKFVLRKDYNDGIFPKNLETIPNLEYGGYAFSNGLYVPLEEEIELMRPDTSIYSNMEKKMVGDGTCGRTKIFKNLMSAEHCRLSLDDSTIWERYPSQFKYLKTARNIIFHDYNLGAIPGAFEEVQSLLARARTDGWATRVGMKFPVCVTEGKELLKWLSLKPNSTFYSLRFDGVIDDDSFQEFISQCREKSVYKQLEYYVTASSANEQEFVEKYVQKIFRQVIKSRSYRVFFSLKYEENFFFDNRWERVLDLFNFYHNSLKYLPQSYYYNKISSDTLFDFAKNSYSQLPKYCKNYMDRKEMRELFAFVREKNPSLFEDFYEFNINSKED